MSTAFSPANIKKPTFYTIKLPICKISAFNTGIAAISPTNIQLPHLSNDKRITSNKGTIYSERNKKHKRHHYVHESHYLTNSIVTQNFYCKRFSVPGIVASKECDGRVHTSSTIRNCSSLHKYPSISVDRNHIIRNKLLKELFGNYKSGNSKKSVDSKLYGMEKIMELVSMNQFGQVRINMKKHAKKIIKNRAFPFIDINKKESLDPILTGCKVHINTMLLKSNEQPEETAANKLSLLANTKVLKKEKRNTNKTSASFRVSQLHAQITEVNNLTKSQINSRPATKSKSTMNSFQAAVESQSSINKVFSMAHEFSCIVFGKKEFDLRAILSYSHLLGIPFAKKPTPEYIKSKECSLMIKEKIANYVINIISASNNFIPKAKLPYKYFVGQGNNSYLVKSLIKQRWWWVSIEKKEMETANFVWTQLVSKRFVEVVPKIGEEAEEEKLMNHLENHIHLSNKKALFYNMQHYLSNHGRDYTEILPITFHIKSSDDDEMERFAEYFESNGGIWIIKPGEYTNRGKGIKVYNSLEDIRKKIKKSDQHHTSIVQKYIEKPLLINKRKFDIRCYGMVTSINGKIKGYAYSEGYIRTSSKEFTVKNLSNKYIHLTNDAIQANCEEYGKYESGNKLTYQDFQKYLTANYPKKNIDFYKDINTQIKTVIADTFKATFHKLDPNKRKQCFEVYGYDFMLDTSLKLYLIEVNTNPCLETTCPVLMKVIPTMLDNALRLSLDLVFRPPPDYGSNKKTVFDIWPENKFELVFEDEGDSKPCNIEVEIEEKDSENEC